MAKTKKTKKRKLTKVQIQSRMAEKKHNLKVMSRKLFKESGQVNAFDVKENLQLKPFRNKPKTEEESTSVAQESVVSTNLNPE